MRLGRTQNRYASVNVANYSLTIQKGYMKSLIKVGLILVAVMAMIPATASASNLEERYQRLYDRVAEQELGPYAGLAGRNLVKDGKNDQREATSAELRESISALKRMLHPVVYTEPTEPVSEAPVAAEPTSSSSGTSNATVQCESGGDYGANTGNGYYGGYQFDSQTWDAYGDPAYSEANEAPPAVQDAAAASVPYDAWPNC